MKSANAMASAARWLLVANCLVAAITGETIDVSPKSRLVRQGESTWLLCRVPYQVVFCRIEVPGMNPIVFTGNYSDAVYSYYGGGLDRGECGIKIHSVTNANNGVVNCTLPNAAGSGNEIKEKMILTVAKPPSPPTLAVERSRDGYFSLEDTLRTECTAAGGRPVATLSWFLDDEPLVDGLTQLRKSDNPSTDTETVRQNLTRRITAQDDGRNLRCVAEHAAFDRPQVAQFQLRVQYPPQPREDPIIIYGVKIGEDAYINVTVKANPQPSFVWTVDGKQVGDSSYDPDARLETTIIPLGNSTYNATLIIPAISREDTDLEYLLRVNNAEGLFDYRVRISTEGEPEGVELGLGGIIGIILAILIVLIAVFLIIFAKATNRWCFGGGVLRTDLPDSGDSEAPVTGDKGDRGWVGGAVNHDYSANENWISSEVNVDKKPDTAV